MRWMVIGGMVLGLAGAMPTSAQEASVAEATIDVMNQMWGKHPGLRANHTKGILVEGSFQPTSEAAKLSNAALFAGGAVPVTARFSNATGLPDIADGATNANPHGLALRFHLPDGGEVDMVMNSLRFFPVATGEDFLALLTAVTQSPPDAPKPTKVEQFMASHPAAPAAFKTASTPVSFAKENYFGINAFHLVDAEGKRQAVRFQLVPAEGAEHLSTEAAVEKDRDYLMQDLKERLQKGPVRFALKAQLAEAGDPIDDATQPWPEARKVAELGTVTLEKPAADQDAAKALLFLPTNLTEGIEASDDPLIQARVDAYAVSFARRSE